jgi:YHS domain-containing protein
VEWAAGQARAKIQKQPGKSTTHLENVNSLYRIIRSLLWGTLVSLVLWLLRRVLRSAVARKSDAARTRTHVHPGAKPIALQRDPVCGAYISPEISLKLALAGGTQHFCSAACRDRYLQSAQRAASA